MSKYHIPPAANNALLEHLREWCKFVDRELIPEWHTGIDFLYDFGMISLEQWDELYNLFTKTMEG